MKNLLSIIFISASCLLYSQDSLKQYKNSVGLELFGETGGRYNITYSRQIYTFKNDFGMDGYITLLPSAISRGFSLNLGFSKTMSKHNIRISLGAGRGTTPYLMSYLSIPRNVRDQNNIISGSFTSQSSVFVNLGIKYKYQVGKRFDLFFGSTQYYYPYISQSFVNKNTAVFFIQSIGTEFNF